MSLQGCSHKLLHEYTNVYSHITIIIFRTLLSECSDGLERQWLSIDILYVDFMM